MSTTKHIDITGDQIKRGDLVAGWGQVTATRTHGRDLIVTFQMAMGERGEARARASQRYWVERPVQAPKVGGIATFARQDVAQLFVRVAQAYGVANYFTGFKDSNPERPYGVSWGVAEVPRCVDIFPSISHLGGY